MRYFYTILYGLVSLLAVSQTTAGVGIGVDSPTQELDIQGNIKIRELSNQEGRSAMLFALPNGTLAAAIAEADPSTPGLRFIGFLGTDLEVPFNAEVSTIIPLTNEALDVFNEYNPADGRYIPRSDGLYKLVLSYTLDHYPSTTVDLDFFLGVFSFADTAFAAVKEIRHRNSNRDAEVTASQRYSQILYFNLKVGKEYAFTLFGVYQSTLPDNELCNMIATEDGSPASSFSIEKLD